MVATWGGYIFILNMVGDHAAFLVIMGRFSTKVYLSYSLFYMIGTALAIQVPIVGWAPLKSVGPCAVFCGFQGLQFLEVVKHRHKLSWKEAWKLCKQVFGTGLVICIILVSVVAPSGYFGPILLCVHRLFVKHTKTGNPLVDSVAEHQPASSQAYFQHLHHVCVFAPVGYLMVLLNLSDSSTIAFFWCGGVPPIF